MAGLSVPFKPLGRPPKFTPAELLEEFGKYVEERTGDPIIEEEVETTISGKYSKAKTKEMRHPQLLSIGDFCVYLGCARSWWLNLSDDFLIVKEQISAYIEQYQLKGASAGVFNGNIISRLLGLTEKTETTTQASINVQVSPDAMAGLQQALKTGAQPRKPKDEQ